jgi:hypothetical protein
MELEVLEKLTGECQLEFEAVSELIKERISKIS